MPFVGQKRQIIKQFRDTINQIIPNDGQDWTIVDVFGGSGLLAHNAKYLKPKAQVIYNDFDGYSQRLKHISDTNRLRHIIKQMIGDYPRQKRLTCDMRQSIITAIHQFDGFIDYHSISTWLLFSGKQISNIDELHQHEFYNTVRISDYANADDYLDGLEIVSESFETLMTKYYAKGKTLFVLDPPYLKTKQESYGLGEYFGMVQFLKLMQLVRPPYMFFSSTKSEVLGYMDYLKKHDAKAWQRVGGFTKFSFNATINKSAKYEDNMIYKV